MSRFCPRAVPRHSDSRLFARREGPRQEAALRQQAGQAFATNVEVNSAGAGARQSARIAEANSNKKNVSGTRTGARAVSGTPDNDDRGRAFFRIESVGVQVMLVSSISCSEVR